MNIVQLDNQIQSLKQQSKNLFDLVSVIKHTEPNIIAYLNRMKKLSFQSFDLNQEMEKTFNALKFSIRDFEAREKARERSKKEIEDREKAKNRRDK
jgi:acetolactate synthase small subunit